ncbi:MAG: signal peptidase I [Candidatus Pacebacteria bacterium CG_4_10_14_0_8_um_filter_43_12]|nr:MAG: signal peptidase I [Candidatus Pacebacteria bacterium CG_4_10_14_0_8_um_filter_43_12]
MNTFSAKALLTSIFILVLLSAASVVLLSGKQRFFGWQLIVVKSGSMEPNLPTGSLLFVKETAAYKIGDIITYRSIGNPNTLITHRIETITSLNSSTELTTRGDANPATDIFSVPLSSVIGKVDGFIPWVGYAISFLQTPLGAVIFVIIPGTILIYEEIRSLYRNINGSLNKNVITSVLILCSACSLYIPVTFAAYSNLATLQSAHFFTTKWLSPELIITQEGESLYLLVKDIEGSDIVEYSVTYKHVVTSNQVQEQLIGLVNKPLSENETVIGPLYIGTCTSEGVCTPHSTISEMKAEVVLKTGSTLNEILLATVI